MVPPAYIFSTAMLHPVGAILSAGNLPQFKILSVVCGASVDPMKEKCTAGENKKKFITMEFRALLLFVKLCSLITLKFHLQAKSQRIAVFVSLNNPSVRISIKKFGVENE